MILRQLRSLALGEVQRESESDRNSLHEERYEFHGVGIPFGHTGEGFGGVDKIVDLVGGERTGTRGAAAVARREGGKEGVSGGR